MNDDDDDDARDPRRAPVGRHHITHGLRRVDCTTIAITRAVARECRIVVERARRRALARSWVSWDALWVLVCARTARARGGESARRCDGRARGAMRDF